MMGKTLYKTYANLTNIVIRVSDGTPEGKNHAVLVSAHLDSTSIAPCLVPVQRMMHSPPVSCLTVYACSRTPPAGRLATPSSSVSAQSLFLLPRPEFRVWFNHGEESLQDASHLFSAQHSIAHTCVLAPPTRLQSRFLHVILLVYAHLVTWKVGSVTSTHCYFLMALLSCRK